MKYLYIIAIALFISCVEVQEVELINIKAYSLRHENYGYKHVNNDITLYINEVLYFKEGGYIELDISKEDYIEIIATSAEHIKVIIDNDLHYTGYQRVEINIK